MAYIKVKPSMDVTKYDTKKIPLEELLRLLEQSKVK